jgi:hypothetical protein
VLARQIGKLVRLVDEIYGNKKCKKAASFSSLQIKKWGKEKRQKQKRSAS